MKEAKIFPHALHMYRLSVLRRAPGGLGVLLRGNAEEVLHLRRAFDSKELSGKDVLVHVLMFHTDQKIRILDPLSIGMLDGNDLVILEGHIENTNEWNDTVGTFGKRIIYRISASEVDAVTNTLLDKKYIVLKKLMAYEEENNVHKEEARA